MKFFLLGLGLRHIVPSSTFWGRDSETFDGVTVSEVELIRAPQVQHDKVRDVETMVWQNGENMIF